METNDRWVAMAPAVAKHFLGKPTKETDKEIRWGRKHSKCLLKASGCLTDFEMDPGRSLTVLELVQRELQTDHPGAILWLKHNGHLPESPTSRNVGRSARRSARPIRQRATRAKRPLTAQKPKDDNEKNDTQKFAVKLWGQAEAIDTDGEHPFRLWAQARNLLHPYCAVPPAIRWSRYRGGAIVAGVFPLNVWGSDGAPFALPVAVQLIAIDRNGNKRNALGPNNDLDKCSYGEVSAGVFILGDPTSERVNICEGVADALAVYSREPGAVLATLGTSTTLANKADVIDWLCARETWLYSDNDKAGDKGTEVLIDRIKVKSPGAVVRKPKSKTFGDPGEWAEKTPFADIEKYDFDEKSGIFYDSGLAWGEANRIAVQTLMGRDEQ